MKEVELLIIGSGPAGLCAAISAASSGARVLVLERSFRPGGQLIKQTHMFFGSESQYASHRGVDIAGILLSKIEAYGDQIEIMLNATAVGFYEDNVVTVLKEEKEYFKVRARSIICATGAYEKSLAFPNNDLPGIYGAGAVQTLMNVYGIRPGDRVLMVGAGRPASRWWRSWTPRPASARIWSTLPSLPGWACPSSPPIRSRRPWAPIAWRRLWYAKWTIGSNPSPAPKSGMTWTSCASP